MNKNIITKKSNNNNNNKIGYSFWGMIATIVGVVIGIGIFFKSEEIIKQSGSIMSIFVWIVGSIIVGCMLLAYIEISSSTSKTGEVGSLSTWTMKFFNTKLAKWIGLFITFVYLPGILILLSSISTTFIIEAIILAGGDSAFDNSLKRELFIIFVSAIFLVIAFSINTFLRKGGEKVQIIGTFLKFIPFFVVIVIGFFMAISGAINGGASIDNIPPSSSSGVGNYFSAFFLSMPAILFSFDGFIYSANLQNEMQDKKKFPKVVVVSILIISLTYILVSIMSVWLGDVSTGDNGEIKYNFSIPYILNKMFGGQAWISVIVLIIISISGLTGVNGLTMSSIHAFRSLSEENMINDKNNIMQKKDKNNIPRNSSYAIFIAVAVWFVLFWIMEIVRANIDSNYIIAINGGKNVSNWTGMIDGVMSANVIIVNFIYSFVIFGAIMNRKTNKVDVDKQNWFLPVAWIGMVGAISFGIFNIINIIVTIFGVYGPKLVLGAILTITLIFVQVFITAAVYWSNEFYIKKHGLEIGSKIKNNKK